MGFRLKENEFFRGTVREPDGDGEYVVVSRGTRAAVVKNTVIEAGKRNWDWVIDLIMDISDEDSGLEVLASWSSLQGDLPPDDRHAVAELK